MEQARLVRPADGSHGRATGRMILVQHYAATVSVVGGTFAKGVALGVAVGLGVLILGLALLFTVLALVQQFMLD